MGKINKSFVLALILFVVISSFLTVEADSSPPIQFPGGVNLYSPINQTYNSHYITLNVTIELGAALTLTYKIDNGTYHGQIPLQYRSGGVVISTYNGTVELPYLPSGNHSLTIIEEAKVANRMETWTDNVTFSISSDEPSPSPTPNVPESSYLPTNDRNAPHLDPIFYLIPFSVIVAVVILSLLLYRKHRKTSSLKQ